MKKMSRVDYICGWNRYTMDFIGIWPDERRFDRITSYKVLIPVCFMLCFICLPQTINLFYVWTNFNLVVENLSMGNMTITISLLKTIVFWLNGQLQTQKKNYNIKIKMKQKLEKNVGIR
ncbi:odorant receptor 13a-like [Vespula maculifrons]|uniref:Odorant receptor 13a-like n=1 Tax=Vespula maculifrons TaxID=7453 RepID=A0ABD2C2F0_VESMC